MNKDKPMTHIVYHEPVAVYSEEFEEFEEEEEDVKEDFFAVLSLLVGAILFVLLLAAIWVLRWDTKYSLYCGKIYNPTRILSRAFWMRLVILLLSTLVLNFRADMITLSLYIAIVYCTIFHDLFFRRVCPPDAVDKVVQKAQEAYDKGIQVLAQGKVAVSAGFQALVEKSTQLTERIGNKIAESKTYIQQHGHELTDLARSTLTQQLQNLETALTNIGEALTSQSEEVLQLAMDQAEIAYQTTYEYLGKIVAGILEYFVGPKQSSMRSGEEWRVGSFFERADQDVADLFERAEQEAKKRKRAELRHAAADGMGGVELTDVTLGEMFQQWFGGKDADDILDQRLAKEMGVRDVKDLPADLPQMMVNPYKTPDKSWDPVQQKWVPARPKTKSRSPPMYAEPIGPEGPPAARGDAQPEQQDWGTWAFGWLMPPPPDSRSR